MVVIGTDENVFSINECPSEEPLLMFSDIVRVSNEDCWETIAGSSADVGVDDESRGMFEFEPDIEYNEDGIVVDDGPLD